MKLYVAYGHLCCVWQAVGGGGHLTLSGRGAPGGNLEVHVGVTSTCHVWANLLIHMPLVVGNHHHHQNEHPGTPPSACHAARRDLSHITHAPGLLVALTERSYSSVSTIQQQCRCLRNALRQARMDFQGMVTSFQPRRRPLWVSSNLPTHHHTLLLSDVGPQAHYGASQRTDSQVPSSGSCCAWWSRCQVRSATILHGVGGRSG